MLENRKSTIERMMIETLESEQMFGWEDALSALIKETMKDDVWLQRREVTIII